jgi:acyl-coenzyme A synthetase/AMP-(fatty) acid ligase
MKVRIGRSRSRADAKRSSTRSPLEIALGPAFSEGEWDVPGRFNFTRDVVDVLARDTKRRALMHLGRDGIIEPRTFHQISESTSRWAALLLERGVSSQDRMVVVAGSTPEWVEIMLAGIRIGAVTIPCSESISAAELEARVQSSDAKLIVASRAVEGVVASLDPRPDVVYTDERPGRATDPVPDVPAEDTPSRDAAFILSSSGTAGAPMGVVHSHGAAFAARVQAEHWLDAGPGDAVWCTSDSGNALALWAVLGTWSRGAEVILHADAFDPDERLDLIDRLGATVLCQTPAEYAALTELRAFRRYRPQRLRRLVSTGDTLARDVIATYEEVWGMTIHEGYGQVETGVVVANGIDTGFRSGSVGLPIVGHEVAVIDDQGNVVDPEVEGELAVRGRPPSLFLQYWGEPEETKAAFRGDWFATGDIAKTDEDGFILLAGRAGDMITSRGRRFGPFEIEHALRGHEAVVDSAAVGIRDLERGGHFVRAFVVLRPGIPASEQLEAELRGFVESALPEYAVPREIEFLDELPRTPSGNIRRAVLREQQVAGRPLWETTSTTEPEPLLPSPEPEPSPAPPADPAGFVVQEYFPHPEPGPVPAEEQAWTLPPETIAYLEPPSEPPVPPEPVAFLEPEPVAFVEPEPDPVSYVEPEPEPTAYVEPEPSEVAPETPPASERATAPEPDSAGSNGLYEPPAAEAASVPTVEPAADDDLPTGDEPAAVQAVESVAYTEPEPIPAVEVEPEAPAPEIPELADAEILGAPEPEPEPAAEQEAAAHLAPVPEPPTYEPAPEAPFEPEASAPAAELAAEPQLPAEPTAYLEAQPDREPSVAEPPVEELRPAALEPALEATPAPTPEPAPEPTALADEEEPLEPLPDYVVDPNAAPRAVEGPVEAGTGDTEKPDLSGLGLRPVNFELDRAEPERPTAPKRPRPEAPPPTDSTDRRSRSTGEPGDELDEVDWMGGLSTRLSAYSLSQDEDLPQGGDAEREDAERDAD